MSKKYLVKEESLSSVADAIREKTNTSDPMLFPSEFISNIESIISTGDDIVAAINASSGLIDDDNLSVGVRDAVAKAHDVHTIEAVAGLQSALDLKETVTGATTKANTAESNAKTYADNQDALKADKTYVDSKVQTDVPSGAKFTDTITTINGKTGTISKADIVALGIPTSDTNTTYTEITTTEIDVGTSTTLRTITARRLKYLLDKIVALFPTKTSDLTNDSGFLTSVTKSDVGLGNVDNTSDLNKPISTAQQTALSLKADKTYVDSLALGGEGSIDPSLLESKADVTYVDSQDELKADKTEVTSLANKVPSTKELVTVVDKNQHYPIIMDNSGEILGRHLTQVWGGSAFVEDESLGVGDNALANNTGAYSNGFGQQSLLDNEGPASNGFGQQSLQSNTGGNSNGFGYQSLQNNAGHASNGFGNSSLQNNEGYNSSGFGHQSLQNNKGDHSSGFGYYSLNSNTGAYSNGFGDGSLAYNIGANSNGFGHQSLSNNTGANSNGFGYESLAYSSGDNSNGFGYQSLLSNRGENSNGFGREALSNNEGANSNGFGYESLFYNIGANSNGFGNGSLQYNLGENSSGFGAYALQNNEGENSSGFGAYALQNNTGANNTAMGVNANAIFTENIAGSKTFDATAVDFDNYIITITGHGFGENDTETVVKYSSTTGTEIGGLVVGTPYKFYIVDENTIGMEGMTSQGTGTHTFTPSAVYSNTTCLGANTVPNKSNQVVLGDDSVDTVKMGGTFRTPASGTAEGVKGETCWDADYFYVCVETDTWKRTPLRDSQSERILENYTEKLVTLSGTSTAIDLSLANVFAHTLTGNTTYSITNAVSGQAHSFTLIINQTATVRTLTFPSSVKWQGGEIPDMSTANKTYILTFMTVNGGTTWLGVFGGEF